jgi:putative heme-binding domain-containing protein
VSYTGKESTRLVKTTGSNKKSTQARALRQKLEAFHGREDAQALNAAWPHLNSEDRFIRYAARIAVESQPITQWQQRALAVPGKTELLALARNGDSEVKTKLIEMLPANPLGVGSGIRQFSPAELRILQVCFARMGRPDADTAAELVRHLNSGYPADNWPRNRELSQLLIYLDAPGVVKKTLDLRDAAGTQEEQIHYMAALRNVKSEWTLDERRRYLAWFQNRPKTEDGGPTYPGGASYFISRNTKHPAELVQWFKDVGREYGDGASLNNFIKKLRAGVVESLNDDEKNLLAGFISDARATAAAKPKKEYKFVREWKMSDFAADLERAGKGRNFESGRDAYAATQCLQCHRLGNEGGAIGPDITAVASRFTRADLLSSLIEPSKVLSEQYQNLTVVKKDGDDVTGRLVEETDTKLVLVPNQLTGEKVEVMKSDVQSRMPSKLSPMPEGLVNILSKEEMLDLLAYIESGGKRDHAAFKP